MNPSCLSNYAHTRLCAKDVFNPGVDLNFERDCQRNFQIFSLNSMLPRSFGFERQKTERPTERQTDRDSNSNRD